MDNNQSPFSLYDFLGYFLPGAVFLYGAVAIVGRFYGFQFHSELGTRGFNHLETYAGLIILAYILGHALSFLSSVVIEKFSIWMHGYPSKYLLGLDHPGYFSLPGGTTPLPCGVKFMRLCVWIFLLPISFQEYIFGNLLGRRNVYVSPADSTLRAIIKAKICDLLEENSGLMHPPEGWSWKKHDFFRFVYHYVLANSQVHRGAFRNYVALFGLSRTLALISVFAFWFSLGMLIYCDFDSRILKIMFFSSIPLSFIYYMTYNKFFRRFSLEVLMALATTHKVKNPIDPAHLNL